MITFTPAGIEKFFEETLESAPQGVMQPPDNVNDVAARYATAGTALRHDVSLMTEGRLAF